jgi:hypothetical protein
LLVPSEAVIRTGARTLVMLALPDGRYRPAEVRTGREGGGKTEILAGLAVGEKVVASGQFLLDSEASLTGIAARPIGDVQMIAAIIRASVKGRGLVIGRSAGVDRNRHRAVRTTPVDALPDLSDVQVIIRTSYPGQAPQIVENQVTYPIASTMLSVPGARVVRGYSFTGDSFVYVLFRRRHRPLLGAQPRARISEPGAEPSARRGQASLGARCHGGGLDLRICAGRQDRAARSGAVA